MIIKFTNRLKGGILVHPNLIKKGSLLIAGVTGDGNQTGEIWQKFMELNQKIGLKNKLSDNGYEIRIYNDVCCECHVGLAVSDSDVDESFSIVKLPASEYASFDVYVSRGYDSENSAMNEWLETNEEGYSQKMYDGKPYCIEYYDERFQGNEADSIVEIWVPIEKKNS
jgi:predicted transcriptional regulator YdeE